MKKNHSGAVTQSRVGKCHASTIGVPRHFLLGQLFSLDRGYVNPVMPRLIICNGNPQGLHLMVVDRMRKNRKNLLPRAVIIREWRTRSCELASLLH